MRSCIFASSVLGHLQACVATEAAVLHPHRVTTRVTTVRQVMSVGPVVVSGVAILQRQLQLHQRHRRQRHRRQRHRLQAV